MTYLLELGFDQNDISTFQKLNNDFIIEKASEFKEIVESNLKSLIEIGVTTYKEMFLRHADLFLMDNEMFKAILEKYEISDLVAKLNRNPDLIEQL